MRRDGQVSVLTGRQAIAALWDAWELGTELTFKDIDNDTDPVTYLVRIAGIEEKAVKPSDAARWGESQITLILEESSPGAAQGSAHTHAGLYAPLVHLHTGIYAPLDHEHEAADIISGVLAAARIATGVPDGTKFLRDDQTWAPLPAPVDPVGCVLIGNPIPFAGVASISANNVFTSEFRNYRIVINIDSVTAAGYLHMRLRAAGVDAAAANYFWGQLAWNSAGGFGGAGANSAAQMTINYMEAAAIDAPVVFDLTNPAVAKRTSTYGMAGRRTPASNLTAQLDGNNHDVATAYDGLTIFPASGLISGELRVYGYRNAP